MTPIHIAPCSCELHVRIRELEAELDKERLANRILRSPIYEGAAAGSMELAQRAVEVAERAKARVAELERMEEFWHNLASLNVAPDRIEYYLKNPSLLLPPDMLESKGED